MAIVKEKTEIINIDIKEAVDRIDNYIRKDINLFRLTTDIQDDSFYMELDVKRSLASLGEIMELKAEKIDENKMKLNIVSRCIEKKSLIDWGKNNKNIEGVFSLFEKERTSEK